jgi:hypothetical protein
MSATTSAPISTAPAAAIPTHTFPSNYQNHDHHLLAALCAWNRARGTTKTVGELKLGELSQILQDAAARRREEQFRQAIEILSVVPERWPRLRATLRWFYREVICG